MKLRTLLITASLLLAGCYGPPTAQEVAAVGGYGAPLTIDYQAAAKAWLLSYLRDPYTAQYIFSQPFPGTVRLAPDEGFKLLAGYKVIGHVNARGYFGRYYGFQPFLFLFRDNQLIFAVGPNSPRDVSQLMPYE